MGIRIIASGKGLPEKYVTNDQLCQIVDTTDEWIQTRTGIQGRYQCQDYQKQQESCVSLAIKAAREALNKANIDKNEIGLIIVATSTADDILPSVACMVQKALGLDEEVMCFDLSAACTGFLYGLGVAKSLLQSMKKSYALVIGSEQLSRIIDYDDRGTCILFGDGAGATLLSTNDKLFAQKSWTRGCKEALFCQGVGQEDQHIRMDGKAVFRFAVGAMAQGICDILEENDMTMDDVDYIVCHQANQRIIDHVKKKFKGYENKFYINIEKYGNTSAASIALALDDLHSTGRISEGMRILCVGFGAGLTWSSILMEI